MADCSKNKNPLIRNGVNRKDRVLPGLDVNYVLPEEHTFADWLVYARDLAAHIKYYNPNSPSVSTENWQPFFDSDVSAQLALIAVQDVEGYKNRIRALFDSIKSEEYKSDILQLKTNFGLLFGAVLSLAYRLDYFYKILPDTVPLKRGISNLVQIKLAPVLRRLLTYYRAADVYYQPKLLLEVPAKDWTILGYQQENAKDIIQKGLSEMWITKYSDDPVVTDWSSYISTVIKNDHTIYNYAVEADGSVDEDADLDTDNNRQQVKDQDVYTILNHVVNHNLFSGIFAEALSGYARIVNDAKKQLVKTVSAQNTHEPHYALYLTFLHLISSSTSQLNTYTQRHLDFYYKDILKLGPKPSEPNHVHLVFELANNTSQYLVKGGAAFKAGKDSLGKDVVYKSDEDIIVNKASVAYLSSFYRAISTDITSDGVLGGSLYASPIANSADGIGGKLTTDEGDWHPFVNKTFTDGNLTGIVMPKANIGMAIASSHLFLKEGKRTITISWNGTALSALNGKKFDCYITNEKGWSEVKEITISAGATEANAVINIAAGEAPVTVYDQKVHIDKDIHQQAFSVTDVPVIKFLLKDIHPTDQYDALKDVGISSIDIKVNVGTLTGESSKDGVKELLIATDTGTVDPSKPFLPFGQNPKKGVGLVIGNKEVFSKPNTKIKLFIEWADLTMSIQDMDVNLTNEFFPTAQVKFLENGVWVNGTFMSSLNKEHKSQSPGEVELFWGADSVMLANAHLPSTQQLIPPAAVSSYADAYVPYNISSRAGFMKLELNADFQWDDYFMKLQVHLIKLATEQSTVEPTKPYLPKIQSIYLSYESETTINFAAKNSSSYVHLYPFGTDAIDKTDLSAGAVKLLPQFVHDCKDGVNGVSPNQAEFYIGLANVVPAQEVNLLFKVLDGSTDPLQQKPKQHITWSYLKNNKWIDYEEAKVNDTTQQLLTTGIISFPIPEAATNTNTVLPSGYHWLRAGISGLPEEVCRLIAVKAQAVGATFYDQSNAADFLATPLAAGTVSKLVEADPAIKKVEQPYSSFGGRYQEDSQNFYTRISERLRHKNRAITIRDIEQLILEKFDDIHRVKCLNHTRPLAGGAAAEEAKCGNIIKPVSTASLLSYNELAPGHVTVLTIPDLRNKNAVNPLRPYTSKSRLLDIENFLLSRANCNMKWHIVNPQFEEVRIETIVILTDEAAGDDAYYKEQLKNDLVKFLTPWAFDLTNDIKFGGKLARSVVINFIEELSYVDVILELKMFRNNETTELDEITAASYSILVAAPVSKQSVTINQKKAKSQTSGCK